MTDTPVDSKNIPSRDIKLLRLTSLIGGVLITLFMIGDLQLVPGELSAVYFENRVFFQLPIVFALFVLTFHPRFPEFAQPAFLLAILGLTFTNYYLIHVAWERAAFSFPYEGTLLYAFFGFFVLGLRLGYSLCLMALSSLGFIGLMLLHPVYGDRTFMNVGFVVGSLLIGVIGRYRLDNLISKLEVANETLLTLSTTDPLTQLFNRRAFTSESERLFDLQRRSGQSLTVFIMDLDHFKQFNDRYGHQAGDRAIRCQADIMRTVFKRQTDFLGRYGGEEFVAVTIGDSPAESRLQAEEVLALWQEMAIPSENSPSGDFLSCSIGVCQGSAADFDSLEDMILAADQALYQAKNMGRGRFVVAGPGKQQGQWARDDAQFSQ
ncbi:GGDEF domain-containing protein [Marinobacter sp.]|uniref:GGDEF domain-containing protein n=1 Tax=Marinobacter sp. TaxID=50741 RepID=UPI002B46C764|nr:GGDEF domain-containing protein [Marinobacter sp.]HKK55670.1 GGDEF domain-containing protein [Marinobacter sp.]